MIGVFGVDPALDRVPAEHDIVLLEGQGLTRGDPDLLLDEVDARHQLRDRVLNLDSRVDLDEVEVVGRVNQEFTGSRVHVPRCPRQPNCGLDRG